MKEYKVEKNDAANVNKHLRFPSFEKAIILMVFTVNCNKSARFLLKISENIWTFYKMSESTFNR